MNSKINNTKKALQNMQLKVIEVTKTNYTLDNVKNGINETLNKIEKDEV